MEGHEDVFKSLFKPYVINIQNHGRAEMAGYVYDKVNDAYKEKDSRTFLCSDLLRSQMGGLLDSGLLDSSKEGWSFIGNFSQKDFSKTGAARTMALDVKKFIGDGLLTGLVDIPDNYQKYFDR